MGEAPVSFECTVDNIVELGHQGGAGNLIISRIQRIHVHTKYLNDKRELDTDKLDLVARTGKAGIAAQVVTRYSKCPNLFSTKVLGLTDYPHMYCQVLS